MEVLAQGWEDGGASAVGIMSWDWESSCASLIHPAPFPLHTSLLSGFLEIIEVSTCGRCSKD